MYSKSLMKIIYPLTKYRKNVLNHSPKSMRFNLYFSLIFNKSNLNKLLGYLNDVKFGFENAVRFQAVSAILLSNPYLRKILIKSPQFYRTLGGSAIKIYTIIKALRIINKKFKTYSRYCYVKCSSN